MYLFYLWYIRPSWQHSDYVAWNARRVNELRVRINVQVDDVNQFEVISRNYSRSSILRKTTSVIIIIVLTYIGTRWRIWLRHCATSWKVAGFFPDGIIGISQ